MPLNPRRRRCRDATDKGACTMSMSRLQEATIYTSCGRMCGQSGEERAGEITIENTLESKDRIVYSKAKTLLLKRKRKIRKADKAKYDLAEPVL